MLYAQQQRTGHAGQDHQCDSPQQADLAADQYEHRDLDDRQRQDEKWYEGQWVMPSRVEPFYESRCGTAGHQHR